jgi:heat induced stress protein YflT
MATASYLEDVAGGMVTAAAFEDDDAAVSAVTSLRASGVREQDISVIAKDRHRAELVAGDRAWLPLKGWRGLMARLAARMGRDIPKQLRQRYGKALDANKIVVAVAAGGQPPDTIAALLAQSRGDQVEQWWQSPTMLFAPPELAGPF